MRNIGLMSFHVASLLVGFWFRVVLVLWGKLGIVPSFPVFWKNLYRICVIFPLDGWKNSPAKPSRPFWSLCLDFASMLKSIEFTGAEIRMVVARG